LMIWIQVRDVHAGHARLAAAGIPIIRGPATEPWGLTEMGIQDPDGIQIVLAGFPPITTSAATREWLSERAVRALDGTRRCYRARR
jgi:hypothetical protein